MTTAGGLGVLSDAAMEERVHVQRWMPTRRGSVGSGATSRGRGDYPTVLIVHDDPSVRKLISAQLSEDGFETIVADCGEEAIGRARTQVPDLAIVTMSLPDSSGLDLMRNLQASSRLPFILLTGPVNAGVTINALRAGADDCVSTPFSPEELVARVRAILRRCTQSNAANAPFRVGPLTFYLDRHVVMRNDESVRFTRTEWQLLEIFVRYRGKVLLTSEILSEVWGPEHARSAAYLRVWISRLRRKLDPAQPRQSLIGTYRDLGYLFRDIHADDEDSAGGGVATKLVKSRDTFTEAWTPHGRRQPPPIVNGGVAEGTSGATVLAR